MQHNTTRYQHTADKDTTMQHNTTIHEHTADEARGANVTTSISDTATRPARPPGATKWPLERALFALAGTMILASALLSALVSPWFLLLTAFVGANQLLYVVVRACPASKVLQRLGVAPQCRW